jgi:tRNA(Ile)-lysidine synthase
MRGRVASLQAAARDLRYGVMQDIAKACGADRIAVGHTADDQAETVLLWMLRGSGLTGLSGMPACRDGLIVRPLYETKREDVLAYLRDEGVPFRWDSSNGKPIYLRNRIRQGIIPALQQVVPSAVEVLCRLADICREDDRFLDEQVASLCEGWVRWLPHGGWSIDRTFLRRLPRAAQRRVVRNLWRQSDAQHRRPNMRIVERLLQIVEGEAAASGIVVPPWHVTVERDYVSCVPLNQQSHARHQPGRVLPAILTVPGEVIWEGTGQLIHARRLAQNHMGEAGRGRSEIVVDADRISEPLVVRAWEPGDRFFPLGMNGRSKKLQDLFTDLKISGGDRRRVPVVVAPEGIVWVVGYRQDGRWSPNEATKRRVVIKVRDRCTAKGNENHGTYVWKTDCDTRADAGPHPRNGAADQR